jgi:glycerol-3-phosphate dehydrogenase
MLVPWRGRTLIGTRHYPYHGDIERCDVPEPLVGRFVEEVNASCPGLLLRQEDVLLVHAGLLPVRGAGAAGVRLLRRHRIIDHAGDGLPGAWSVRSVKFTTARLVAEQVVDRVFRWLGRRPPVCRTATTPLADAPTEPVADGVRRAASRYGARVAADVIEHLVRSYGSACERVLAARAPVGDAGERVVPGEPVVVAQLAHGASAEMAVRPEDLVWRRTELGGRGLGTPAALRLATRILAERGERVAR